MTSSAERAIASPARTRRGRGLAIALLLARTALGPFRAVGGVAIVVVAWWILVKIFAIEKFIVPSPVDVWHALRANFGLLLDNTWPTVFEAVLGFVVGNGVAVLIAILFVYSGTLERLFFPVAIAVRTIPIVAIAPILVIMFGQGYTSKVIVAALISFFPTLVNTIRGLKAVDPLLLELMSVLSATRRDVFFKVRLQSSLPYLFAALKISGTSCMIGAVVAEWIGAQKGLGYLIVQTTFDFRTPLLWATMVFTSVIAVTFVVMIGFIERLTVRWQPSTSVI